MRYWHGYLSLASCKWFAYGPADATATPSSLAPVKSRMVYLSGASLPRLSWKKRLLNSDSSHCIVSCNISYVNDWYLVNSINHSYGNSNKQEGQHLLTGQHASNFRLLANQWAQRRLVTQWRHSCRAIRLSVCNAGVSNAGQSLWVQISRNGATPCQYIDTTRKAIDCATTLPLRVYI